MTKMLYTEVDQWYVDRLVERCYQQDTVDNDIDLIESLDKDMIIKAATKCVEEHRKWYNTIFWFNRRIESAETNCDIVEIAMIAIRKH